MEEWQLYVDSVVEQARDRDHTRFRTVEEHMALRRFTIGSRPSFVIIEIGLDIPQEVFDHPLLADLRDTITDLLCLDNVGIFPSPSIRAVGQCFDVAHAPCRNRTWRRTTRSRPRATTSTTS